MTDRFGLNSGYNASYSPVLHAHHGHRNSMHGMGITEDQIAENKAAIERAKTGLVTLASLAAAVYFLTIG